MNIAWSPYMWALNVDNARCLFLEEIGDKVVFEGMGLRPDIIGITTTGQCQQETVLRVILLEGKGKKKHINI